MERRPLQYRSDQDLIHGDPDNPGLQQNSKELRRRGGVALQSFNACFLHSEVSNVWEQRPLSPVSKQKFLRLRQELNDTWAWN